MILSLPDDPNLWTNLEVAIWREWIGIDAYLKQETAAGREPPARSIVLASQFQELRKQLIAACNKEGTITYS